MKLQIVTRLEIVAREWKRFERTADCTVFQVFEWLWEWQQRVGVKRAVIPVIVLGRNANNDLLFILPLAIETHRIVRRLGWLGSELCDYHAPLLSPSYRDEVKEPFVNVWQEVLRVIHVDRHLDFDVIELHRMPPTVGSQPNPFLELPRLRACTVSSHATNLPGCWDQLYKAKRSNSTRQKDRRSLKQLAALGEVRFVDEVAAAEISQTMTSLIHQKRLSYARMGVPDIFTFDGFEDFYRAVAGSRRLREITHVSRLDVGQTPVAIALNLKFKGRYYSVMPGYDPIYARYSPGRAHLHEIFKYAISRHMDVFDFTIGDESYKADWEDRVEPIFSYLDNNTLLGKLVARKRLVFQVIDSYYHRNAAGALKRSISKGRRQLHKLLHPTYAAPPTASTRVKTPLLPSVAAAVPEVAPSGERPAQSRNTQIICREIRDTDVEVIIELLMVGFPERPLATWQRAFRRLSLHPTPASYPRYGYMLEHEGMAVGVVLTIFTTIQFCGDERVRCNLSSWYVLPDYRAHAVILSARALRRREVTYINITPHPDTFAIVEAQGYRRYCNGVYITIPALNFSDRAKVMVFDGQPIAEFSAYENRLLLDHTKYGGSAIVLTCRAAGKFHPFVFAPERVCRAPAAYLSYCRSIDNFLRFAGPLGRYLAFRGHPLVMIDADGPIPGLAGRFYDGWPKYFKGPHKPATGDLAYTERPMFGM
jgi:CelD/BcsL family acetyltransferase involved in cellulose biosynthesis